MKTQPMNKLLQSRYGIPILMICAFVLPRLSLAQNVTLSKDKLSPQFQVQITAQPDLNALQMTVCVDREGPVEIILRDRQGRCIHTQSAFYPGPGLYRHVWHPSYQIQGMVLFESTHDGSRRQIGQVVITPP